jgi:hypothetical protein
MCARFADNYLPLADNGNGSEWAEMENRGRVPEKVERQREIFGQNLPGPHPKTSPTHPPTLRKSFLQIFNGS